jgi:hypothetical protein
MEKMLAILELEIKYAFDPGETRRVLRECYVNLVGAAPHPRLQLLDWFLENYEFDGECEWSPKAQYIN